MAPGEELDHDDVSLFVIISQFESLILDGEQIFNLTAEDKAFMQKFQKMEMLSMNCCKLKSAVNLPDVDLKSVSCVFSNWIQLELNDNMIPGEDLKVLAEKYKNLIVLKLCSNKIDTLD